MAPHRHSGPPGGFPAALNQTSRMGESSQFGTGFPQSWERGSPPHIHSIVGGGLKPLPDTGAPPVWDYRAVVPTGILPDYTACCSGPGFPATLNKTQRSRSC